MHLFLPADKVDFDPMTGRHLPDSPKKCFVAKSELITNVFRKRLVVEPGGKVSSFQNGAQQRSGPDLFTLVPVIQWLNAELVSDENQLPSVLVVDSEGPEAGQLGQDLRPPAAPPFQQDCR